MRLPWPWLVLVCVLSGKEPTIIETSIRSVRLHPSEAWVTRVGEVQRLEAGAHRVAIVRLPAGLKLEDLRVTARGPAGTRLGDLTVRQAPQTYEQRPEWLGLVKEGERLEGARQALRGREENLAKARQLFQELKATHAKALQRRLASDVPKPPVVHEFSSAIEGRNLELARQEAALKEEENRLDGLLGKNAEAKEKVRVEGEANPTVVSAELEMSKPGPAELALTYRTRESIWTPAYEARLSKDGTGLELVLFAAVKQETGEPWTGVGLELLSQDPSGRLDLPSAVSIPALSYREGEPSKAAIRGQEALVPTSSLATLRVPGKVDIRPGEVQRFRLTSLDLAPRFRYLAIPRQSADVYRLALVVPPPAFPLVNDSPVDLLQGTERLGTLKLEVPLPGEPLRLSFGPVPGLTARREALEKSRSEVGDKAKEREWVFKERLAVESTLPNAVEVELQDRTIAAGTDSVKVDQTTGSTPGGDLVRAGLRSWLLRLEADGKAAVLVQTRIRGPLVGHLVNLGDLSLEGN